MVSPFSARKDSLGSGQEHERPASARGYSEIKQEDSGQVVAPEEEGPKSVMAKLKEAMGITTATKLLPNGDMEETWEFEEDTYTVAILGIVQNGLEDSSKKLAVALITPVVQVLILFTILERLLATPRHTEEEGNPSMTKSVDSFVTTICFLLMGLKLSNEALEAIGKMCFSMRCFGGNYKDMKGPAWVAIVLAYIQFSISVFTVGTSSLVIAEQPSAQDAFMNFVALAFLTEVDNLIMSSRTVANVVKMEEAWIKVIHAKTANPDEPEPWSLQMCILTNILVMCSVAFNAITFFIAEQALDEGQGNLLTLWQVPSIIVTLLLLNSVLWFGSRKFKTMSCAAFLAFLCMVFVFVDLNFLKSHGYRMTPCLTPMIPFWFALLAVSSANSVVTDPFPFLRCPVQTPSLVWAMLVAAAASIDALYKFGT